MNDSRPRLILSTAVILAVVGLVSAWFFTRPPLVAAPVSPAPGRPAAVSTAKPADQALLAAAGPLFNFFESLYELETGKRKRPVVVVQLGDSHTAAGYFSARLRRLFQERFGTAGRGMLPPGEPFRHYFADQVKIEQNNAWTVANSLNRKTEGIFGLSGYRASSRSSEGVMVLESTDVSGFNWIEIEFLGQPGGGTMTISLDEHPLMALTTANEKRQPNFISLRTLTARARLKLETKGDGPVDLLSLIVQNDRPGVVWDSHGVVGATFSLHERWDQETLAWEINHRDPSLFVVEYGGNEAFDDRLNLEQYEAVFRKRLLFLHQAAPRASILVIGPSDGNRLPQYCLKGKAAKTVYACSSLTEAERESYFDLLKNKDPALCRWHTPPNMPLIRRVQQTIANAQGCSYWDWSVVMEGECGLHKWVTSQPPLAAPDHIHLVAKGYEESAEVLFKDIMYYYDLYRTAQGK